MKKTMLVLISFVLCLVMALSFAACGGNPQNSQLPGENDGGNNEGGNENPSPEQSNQQQDTDRVYYEYATTLVVYFSLPETADPDNMTTEEG